MPSSPSFWTRKARGPRQRVRPGAQLPPTPLSLDQLEAACRRIQKFTAEMRVSACSRARRQSPTARPRCIGRPEGRPSFDGLMERPEGRPSFDGLMGRPEGRPSFDGLMERPEGRPSFDGLMERPEGRPSFDGADGASGRTPVFRRADGASGRTPVFRRADGASGKNARLSTG